MPNNCDFLEGLCILICNYKTSAICSTQSKGKGQQQNKAEDKLLGDIAALICLEALYICRTNGIRLINHSPRLKTDAPSHDDMNTPTKKMKVMDVMKPSPGE